MKKSLIVVLSGFGAFLICVVAFIAFVASVI